MLLMVQESRLIFMIIGSCRDSVFEIYKNISIWKNVVGMGNNLGLKTGTGNYAFFMLMQEGLESLDINISTPNHSTSQS